MSVVFLLAEPVPVWQAGPAYARPQRLTGGWASLLALVGGMLLSVLASLRGDALARSHALRLHRLVDPVVVEGERTRRST